MLSFDRLVKDKKQAGEALRFVIVGALATAIHYGIYYVLQLGIDVNVAYTAGYVVSFIRKERTGLWRCTCNKLSVAGLSSQYISLSWHKSFVCPRSGLLHSHSGKLYDGEICVWQEGLI